MIDIQDLGSIGEIVGAIAVIATLVYLSRQIAQSNSATHRQVYSQAATAVSEFWLNLAKVSKDSCVDSGCDSKLLIWGDGTRFVHHPGVSITSSGTDNRWAFGIDIGSTPAQTKISDRSPIQSYPSLCSLDCHPRTY